MILVSGYAYFFVFLKEQKNMDEKIDKQRIAVSEGLNKISVQTKDTNYVLEYRDQKWWIVEPILYPAKPELLERSLTVMNQVVADSSFPLKEDRYGFSQSSSVMTLEYASQGKKTIVLGSEEGVSSQIYLLNKESQQVYSVHNVWGQLFYYELKDMVSSSLPAKYWTIESVELKEKGKNSWKVSLKGDEWFVEKADLKLSVPKEKLLWWMQSIRNMEVAPVKFNQEMGKDLWFELKVRAKEGEESYFFNKEASEIYITSLKSFAQISAFSLKSIEIELEKVVKNEK